MKHCNKCQSTKPLSDFSIRNKEKGTYQSWCKSCFSIRDKNRWNDQSDERRQKHYAARNNRRIDNRMFVWKYLEKNPCHICGESDPRVLEFDHEDPETKSGNISEMYTYSKRKILEEIAKCKVMCANCHRRKTYDQFEYHTF
jgi:hypothetical protein